jgi:hypothetical protein
MAVRGTLSSRYQQAPGALINSLMSLYDKDAAVCRCLVRAFARRYVPKMAYPPICHLHVGITVLPLPRQTPYRNPPPQAT